MIGYWRRCCTQKIKTKTKKTGQKKVYGTNDGRKSESGGVDGRFQTQKLVFESN